MSIDCKAIVRQFLCFNSNLFKKKTSIFQASPPLDVSTSSTSYATPSTEKTLEQRLAKEIEKFEATKRTVW